MNSNADLPRPTKLYWNINTELIECTDLARFYLDRRVSSATRIMLSLYAIITVILSI